MADPMFNGYFVQEMARSTSRYHRQIAIKTATNLFNKYSIYSSQAGSLATSIKDMAAYLVVLVCHAADTKIWDQIFDCYDNNRMYDLHTNYLSLITVQLWTQLRRRDAIPKAQLLKDVVDFAREYRRTN